MASTSISGIAGIVLIAAGAGLAWWGYDISTSLGSQLGSALGGTSDAVMYRYIGGGASFLAGLFLFLKK